MMTSEGIAPLIGFSTNDLSPKARSSDPQGPALSSQSLEQIRKEMRDKLRESPSKRNTRLGDESRFASAGSETTTAPTSADPASANLSQNASEAVLSITAVLEKLADEQEKQEKTEEDPVKTEKSLFTDLQELATRVNGRLDKMRKSLIRKPKAITVGVDTKVEKRMTFLQVQKDEKSNCNRISILIPQVPVIDEEEPNGNTSVSSDFLELSETPGARNSLSILIPEVPVIEEDTPSSKRSSLNVRHSRQESSTGRRPSHFPVLGERKMAF